MPVMSCLLPPDDGRDPGMPDTVGSRKLLAGRTSQAGDLQQALPSGEGAVP